jgi:hypothetical protein
MTGTVAIQRDTTSPLIRRPEDSKEMAKFELITPMMEQEDLEEMQKVAAGMQDGTEDEEEEIDQLGRRPQVSFGPTEVAPGPNEPPFTPPTKRLQADLSDMTRQGRSTAQRPKPNLWYGLIDVLGAKWLFQDLRPRNMLVWLR